MRLGELNLAHNRFKRGKLMAYENMRLVQVPRPFSSNSFVLCEWP